MARTTKTTRNNRRIVFSAFLVALIVVLQSLAYALAALGFKIAPSLVLVPIVIGGMLLGIRSGAMLGFIFGVITYIGATVGIDAGGAILFAANPWLLFILCVTKATLAALASSAVYSLFHTKQEGIASVLSAAVCPIVNTGVFIIFMLLGYSDTLRSWAAGTDILTYIIIGLVGVNFAVEFFLNVVLVPILRHTLSKSRFVKNL